MSSLADTLSLLGQLGDATRLRLLQLLQEQDLSVAELVRVTELAQPRISTHLRKLRDAQIVVARRQGSSTYYRVNAGMPSAAQTLWAQLQAQLQDQIFHRDAQRLQVVLAARDHGRWPEPIAGQMERHYSPGRTWEAMTQGLVHLLKLGDVLDVGAGDGVLAELAAPRATRWVCLDRSETLLQAARERVGDKAQYVRADMQDLPFADHSFDQVLHFHALTYAEDPDMALAEAARVLRPGGQLLLLTLAPHDAMELAAGYGHLQPGFAPDYLAKLAQRCGLDPLVCDRVTRESTPPFFELVCLHALAHPRP